MSVNTNLDLAIFSCFLETAKLLRDERFNDIFARISTQNKHQGLIGGVADDYRAQGIASLCTSIISSVGNILGGLAGFGGRTGFGWWQNKTVDAITKTLTGIGGAADALGRTVNQFQEGSRYKDQALVDEARMKLDELIRQIEDYMQTVRSMDNACDSVMGSSKEIDRRIAGMA